MTVVFTVRTNSKYRRLVLYLDLEIKNCKTKIKKLTASNIFGLVLYLSRLFCVDFTG
jgi:hypothetical protein